MQKHQLKTVFCDVNANFQLTFFIAFSQPKSRLKSSLAPVHEPPWMCAWRRQPEQNIQHAV